MKHFAGENKFKIFETLLSVIVLVWKYSRGSMAEVKRGVKNIYATAHLESILQLLFEDSEVQTFLPE